MIKLKLLPLELYEIEQLIGEDFWNDKANGASIDSSKIKKFF
jgi:hypothetical protein